MWAVKGVFEILFYSATFSQSSVILPHLYPVSFKTIICHINYPQGRMLELSLVKRRNSIPVLFMFTYIEIVSYPYEKRTAYELTAVQ